MKVERQEEESKAGTSIKGLLSLGSDQWSLTITITVN
jgi:hypothetical protein